jgi:hypothetical protein
MIQSSQYYLTFLVRISGLFFILVPFIPLESLFGQIQGIGGAMDIRGWILVLSILLPTGWFLSLVIESKRMILDNLFLKAADNFRKSTFLICLILMFGIVYLINQIVFSGRPLLIDSVTQMYQAQVFATGALKGTAHPHPEFFMTQHILFEDTGWYAQYPPLHSALLSTGVFFSMAWCVPAILTLGTLWFMFRFVESEFGKHAAIVTFFLFAFSPFFLFMNSSFMNHVSTLFFLSGFLYFYQMWENKNSTKWIVISVLFASMAFLSRPLTAIAFCFPFIITTVMLCLKDRRFISLSSGIITALAGPAMLMVFQMYTTGDPFLPAYIKLWGEGHGLGFHLSPWGESHTPGMGMKNELGDLRLLQEMLFEWPIPSLFPLGLFLLLKRRLSSWELRLLVSALCIPAFYFFYWHRDAYLGPRFLYESILAFIPLTALSIIYLSKYLDQYRFYIKGLFHSVRAGTIFRSILMLSFFYVVLLGFPQRFLIYKTGLSSVKVDILEDARKHGISSGILFAKVSWGNRLFSEIRGFGVSASMTQRAYSNLDHCLLYKEFLLAREKQYSAEFFEERIAFLLKTEKKPPTLKQRKLKYKVSEDTTLRLDPDRSLDPVCAEELQYDQSLFGIYYPFMRLNSPDFSGNFLFVRDLRDRNSLIMDMYPDRDAYIYSNGIFTKINKGSL